MLLTVERAERLGWARLPPIFVVLIKKTKRPTGHAKLNYGFSRARSGYTHFGRKMEKVSLHSRIFCA